MPCLSCTLRAQILLTISTVGTSLAVALLVPGQAEKIYAVVGATAVCVVCYIIPVFIQLQSYRRRRYRTKQQQVCCLGMCNTSGVARCLGMCNTSGGHAQRLGVATITTVRGMHACLRLSQLACAAVLHLAARLHTQQLKLHGLSPGRSGQSFQTW
jgi:hypothetical protein